MIGLKHLRMWLLVPFLLMGCESQDVATSSSPQEIITQNVTEKGRIPITVLVKYAFSINAFERAVEELFPNVDIIQVGNYTQDRGIIEYERRLQHDDLPDIVMTWPLDVGQKYWQDRLLDLSAMPFTSRYNTSMLNRIANNGKLYYLPGPAQIRGIVYNKTLFQENGWKVPHDYQSFIALCHTIEASGMRSLVLGFKNSEVLDTAFVGYGYRHCFSSPSDAQILAEYNLGKGSFGTHFSSALKTFQDMIDAGIWKASDLDIDYAQRETMLFTRRCAMVEDSVLIARMGYTSTGTTDQFALMPFFNPGTPSDWARLYMVCFIGLNKHLAEPHNKEKYDLVLKLMEYISTPEGQQALAADTGAMYSSVKNVPPPNTPEIEALASTLAHGRYAVFPELRNAQNALRQGLAGMLSGKLSYTDVVRIVDYQNLNPSNKNQRQVLGYATEHFTLIETGNFLTDIMRQATGADVALFLDNGKDGRYNGKGLSGRIYKGDQTIDDVLRILPDLKQGEKGKIQVFTMKGKDLVTTLEHSIPVNNNLTGWFYYFSGLRMAYAPAALPGTRIKTITDDKGAPIDPERLYTIAAMDSSVPTEYIQSTQHEGALLSEVLVQAMHSREQISPSGDGRFTVVYP